jgi:transposase
VDIRQALGCDDGFISRWTRAYAAGGLAGLVSHHPGRAPVRPVAELGDVSFSAVQRIWRKHGVRPNRLDTHRGSDDPDFEAKAAEVIGLYLQPPEHAVVFCVDEKTAIQALDCKDRQLPLSPGRAESHGFGYKRNGTLSLFAALNTATGEVLGKTAQRHTSEQFVRFLEDIVADHDEDQQIHVICDNVSSHKTALVQTWLLLTPNVHIHYTPTYSSWLNPGKIWFAKTRKSCATSASTTNTPSRYDGNTTIQNIRLQTISLIQ